MKKRSLFVATAMLLVAVLVATGATYAWFNSVDKATAEISMGVASGNALQISGTDSDNWVSNLTTADFDTLTGKKWMDFSTVDGTNFFSDTYETDEDGQETSVLAGYKADTSVASATVNFRASAAGKKISLTSSVTNAADLATHVRIAVGGKIFAATGTAYNGVPAEGDVADVTLQEVTPIAFAEATDIATLESIKAADGYYHTSATFYFWVEGTTCSNAMLESVVNDIVANLTFTLEA